MHNCDLLSAGTLVRGRQLDDADHGTVTLLDVHGDAIDIAMICVALEIAGWRIVSYFDRVPGHVKLMVLGRLDRDAFTASLELLRA